MDLSGCPARAGNKAHWPDSLLDNSQLDIALHFLEGPLDQHFQSLLVHRHFQLFLDYLEYHQDLLSLVALVALANRVCLHLPFDKIIVENRI